MQVKQVRWPGLAALVLVSLMVSGCGQKGPLYRNAPVPDAELTEIPPDHPVFHTFYDFPEGLPKIHEHDGDPPQAFGVFHEGRLVVFYSYESDLGDGWEDEDVHGDSEDLREAALRMGVNLFLFVLGQAVS